MKQYVQLINETIENPCMISENREKIKKAFNSMLEKSFQTTLNTVVECLKKTSENPRLFRKLYLM